MNALAKKIYDRLLKNASPEQELSDPEWEVVAIAAAKVAHQEVYKWLAGNGWVVPHWATQSDQIAALRKAIIKIGEGVYDE